MIRRADIVTIAVCMLSAGCGERFAQPDAADEIPAPNITFAALHAFYRGEPLRISEPVVVGGSVTSSDEAGNFYRTLLLDDGTGAAEFRIAEYNLHTLYAPGSYLTASLEGCALSERNGILQIGLVSEASSPYPTEYIASREMLDRILHRSGERRPVEPLRLSLSELDESLCGRLVRIDGLRLIIEPEETGETTPVSDAGSDTTPDGSSTSENAVTPERSDLPGMAEAEPVPTWAGYRLFADPQGGMIAVYTSGYARFADRAVPTAACSLTGILEYGSVTGYGKRFILQMRDEGDCSY